MFEQRVLASLLGCTSSRSGLSEGDTFTPVFGSLGAPLFAGIESSGRECEETLYLLQPTFTGRYSFDKHDEASINVSLPPVNTVKVSANLDNCIRIQCDGVINSPIQCCRQPSFIAPDGAAGSKSIQRVGPYGSQPESFVECAPGKETVAQQRDCDRVPHQLGTCHQRVTG